MRLSRFMSRLLRSYLRKSPGVGTLSIPPAFGGGGVAAEDINNDGHPDVLLVGGLGNALYLNRGDVVAVLRRLPALLKPGGRIVLRESTVRHGVEPKTGSYQVVYRSSAEYTTIIGESGLALERVELNAGYAAMETAVAIVDALRRLPIVRSRELSIVGRTVWRTLRAVEPLSFKIVPGLLERLGVAWPHLQNHFFLVRSQAHPASALTR